MGNIADNRQEKQAQTAMRPIVGLTETLPKDVLEGIVVEAMYRHRYLRDVADLRHADICQGEPSLQARSAYVRAMIDMHAQQTVLSTLLAVLGYIPKTPKG